MFRGDVNIAGRDLIKKIKIIHQRALTAAEAAEKARSIEIKLLAEGIGKYANDLQNRLAEKSESHTPYRGLLEYRLADAKYFFGRDEAKIEIARLVSRSAFSVLHAESGAGKTSLLQAGIMPAILASKHLPIYVRSYDKNPADVIKRTLVADSEFAAGLMKERLADFLRRVTSILGPKTTLILILDQFEEFFTRVQEQDRKSFIDDLSECINNPSLNIRWMFCLRKEYFSDLAAFQPGISDPFENAYLLKPLSRAEAEEAIAKPAKLQKITFEKGLIPELLNDLGEEQILPPHIQLVGSALFENLSQKQKIFTRDEYVKLGKAQGILKNHLDRVLSEKVPKNRIAICQQVLQGLVTSTQQRVLRTEQELFDALGNYPEDQVRDAISLLARNRLLRGEETESGVAYELAHDILLDEIRLNPEIVRRKQAEELLEQGVKIWKRLYKYPFTNETLSVIKREREHIIFNAESASLILLNSANIRKLNEWANCFSDDLRKNIINYILDLERGKDRKEKRLIEMALWPLRKQLPKSMRNSFVVNYFLRHILPRQLAASFIVAVVLLSGFRLLSLFTVFNTDGWSVINNYSASCELSNPGKTLKLSADPIKPSNIYLYRTEQDSLICASKDFGATWETQELKLPANVDILKLEAFNSNIIIITTENIFIQGPVAPRELGLPEGTGKLAIKDFAINPKVEEMYFLLMEDNRVYIHLAGQWKLLPTNKINDPFISIAVNELYIVILTDNYVWAQAVGQTSWSKIALPENSNPISIEMPPQNTNQFYVVTFEKRILTGVVNGQSQITESTLESWPPTESLEFTGNITYLGGEKGVYCQGKWNIFTLEWWSIISGNYPPCYQ